MYLDKIVNHKRKRVELEKQYLPIEYMVYEQKNHAFKKALTQEKLSLIAEIKKASPSKGDINLGVDIIEQGRIYDEAEVDAISVLTEEAFFKGHNDYLMKLKGIQTPRLRKDFLIDSYQIYQTAHMGAEAALLICSILKLDELREYIQLLKSFGIDALVEAHTESEVDMALQAGAEIIGINNRNLKTFEVDFEHAIRLRNLIPKGIITVAESGIKSADDVKKVKAAGFDAILVGETLMRSGDVSSTIKELMK